MRTGTGGPRARVLANCLCATMASTSIEMVTAHCSAGSSSSSAPIESVFLGLDVKLLQKKQVAMCSV